MAASPEDSTSQLIGSLSIIAALTVIAVALICVGAFEKASWALMLTPVGTIIGILGTALNAPTGIGNVIASVKKSLSPQQPSEPTP